MSLSGIIHHSHSFTRLEIYHHIYFKKGPVPDYGIVIDDEVPDFGLEDLFGQQILPQDEKQIVPKPPSYQDVLDEIASGEKKYL